MKINNVSLPYPVLGNSDDIIPSLMDDNIIFSSEQDDLNYTFRIRLHYENEEIKRLVEEGKAEYTCEVTCPRTYIRECKHSNIPEFDITIGRRDVFGRIDFNCYVTVCKPIKGYCNSCQNEDYGNACFDLEPGDVLVTFWPASYNASLQYDKLYSAGSFMVVLNGGDATAPWFDANGDSIKVFLPEEMYQQFLPLSQDRSFNEIFHASIVFNALYKVLSEFKEATYGTYQWAEAIRYRIDHEPELMGMDITDTSHAYELAQALLDNPYKRLFNHLKQQQE